ncbi:MAG: 4a-hydroxytetrahydrobiopterin dehydratase [Terriglobales bacterium]
MAKFQRSEDERDYGKRQLSEQELQNTLANRLRDWRKSGNALVRTFQFPDFKRAIEFVNQVAEKAEDIQHHPDLDIRYNKVTAVLTSHDAGGITRRDLMLAGYMQELAGSFELPKSA